MIDRCIQTARLYASMLGEMPELKRFDIVVMLNVDREYNNAWAHHPVEAFSFRKTIASAMLCKAKDTKAYSIEYLRRRRSDLRWFTDLCAPHAVCRPFALDFHPLLRCLWIVDMNPKKE